MIRILQSPEQVEAARQYIESRGLPIHKTPQKNWDHFLLAEHLDKVSRDARIVDLGCGGGYALHLFHRLGFREICGLDYDVPHIRLGDRLGRILQPSRFRSCFFTRRGDICQTGLPGNSCDVITCISVIEHGVDPEIFLRESARLLKDGGMLFLTFDYWQDFDPLRQPEVRLFDLPWNILNRQNVEQLLAMAGRFDLTLLEETAIPSCGQPMVYYAEREYTFMAIIFKKCMKYIQS